MSVRAYGPCLNRLDPQIHSIPLDNDAGVEDCGEVLIYILVRRDPDDLRDAFLGSNRSLKMS